MLLKLKLQYFGHLMWRVDSLKKMLILENTEGKRKKGRQRIRWLHSVTCSVGFPSSSVNKESSCNAGNLDSFPGLGWSPGEWNGNLLQYSCLENSIDRGARQARVHGIERVGHDLATKPPPLNGHESEQTPGDSEGQGSQHAGVRGGTESEFTCVSEQWNRI